MERDDAHDARLLERLGGSSLAQVADSEGAMAVAGRLARRLAVPAPVGPPRMREVFERWSMGLARQSAALGHPLPARTVAAAVATCRELGPGLPDTLLHGDLHERNILRAEREEWLVMDPLGGVGVVAFECLTPLRDRWNELQSTSTPVKSLYRRIEVFAEAAETDVERAKRWVQVRSTVASLANRASPGPDDGGLHDWVATALAA